MTDDEILDAAVDRFKEARDGTSEWRQQAREDYSFVAGDQWSDEDKATLEEQLRPCITFNRVGPMIDAVSGAESSNRQRTQYIPREVGDAAVNEVLTAAANWIRDECDADEEESDAFRDAVICGIGWTETRIDYMEEADGKVFIERVDPMELYWDPSAKRRNLEDRRYLFRVRHVAIEDFEAEWPGVDINYRQGQPWDFEDGMSDEPHNASRAFLYENDVTSQYNRERGTVAVVEYQWLEPERIYRVINPQSNQLETVERETFEKLRPALETYGVPFTSQKVSRWKRAFIAGHTVLESGDCPDPTSPSYQCITAKRDHANSMWYGLVRGMKDPARWSNKFFSSILHLISTQPKGGLLAEEGAFVDRRKAQEDWASPDSIIFLTSGAISQSKIQERSMPQYPQALDRLMTFTINAHRETTGINIEMMGLAEKNQPGVLEYQRRQAGLTVLSDLFGSLRLYRKKQGRVLLAFIQQFIPPGTLIRVMNDETGRQQYVPMAQMPETARYDVIVDEAPSAPNEKERVFQVLLQMLPSLTQMGVPIPPEVVRYLPIPASLAEKWAQMLAPKQQPDPMQQLAIGKMQADVEETKSKTDLNRAKVISEHAKAIESVADAAESLGASAATQMMGAM